MRRNDGLRRAAAVVLQATLAIGLLIGCAATHPPDGTLDLPHFARQAPSEAMSPSHRSRVSAEANSAR